MFFWASKFSVQENYLYTSASSIYSHIVKFIWLLLESDNLKVQIDEICWSLHYDYNSHTKDVKNYNSNLILRFENFNSNFIS